MHFLLPNLLQQALIGGELSSRPRPQVVHARLPAVEVYAGQLAESWRLQMHI